MQTKVYHISYSPAAKAISLYFFGCNFMCLGCIRKREKYDIHIQGHPNNSPSDKSSTKRYLTIAEILNILKGKDIETVTLMGGEPTIDESLTELAVKLKSELQCKTTLITNGYIFPKLDGIDEVCVSIKAFTQSLHKEYTGRENVRVFENLNKFYKKDVFLRTESIFIPNYIDVGETRLIASAISKVDPSIPHRIDAYIPVPGRSWRRPSELDVKRAVSAAKEYLRDVSYIKYNAKPSQVLNLI